MKREYSVYLKVGTVIITAMLIMMVVSIFFTPYDPEKMDVEHRLQGPTWKHILGTDNFGRDIFSRIMQGSQTAFTVGLVSVTIGLTIGLVIGGIAGYFGGWADNLLMRSMDAMIAFPGIIIALMFVTIWGYGITNTMIALGIMAVPRFARIARSGFLQAKELMYVKMAKSIGVSNLRIMFVHILPNIISPLIVAASLGFASAVLAEAGLSYLGLGVQPPDPSWGTMLHESQLYFNRAPLFSIAPGIMITLLVFGFNMFGDGLRDLNDPRKR